MIEQFLDTVNIIFGYIKGFSILAWSVISLLFTFPVLPFTILGILGTVITIIAKHRR